jgi:hypothetical protein
MSLMLPRDVREKSSLDVRINIDAAMPCQPSCVSSTVVAPSPTQTTVRHANSTSANSADRPPPDNNQLLIGR